VTNLNFDIFGRDHGAGRVFEELKRKVDELQDELNQLNRTDADPNVRLDTSDAERKLKEIQADMDKIQGAKLQITADTARARAEINNVQNQLKELKAQPSSVEVDADVAAAEAKLEELKARLAELKTQRLNFDADTAAARAKIDELKAQIATFRDAHINVDLDTGAAVTRLGALQAMIRAVTNDGSGLSTAFRTVATVIGAGVAATGLFATSLGSMIQGASGGVGAISGLGSVITQIGQSATQAGGSLLSFGSGAAEAGQSVLSAIGSMTSMVASLTAIGAVGAIAVGALGQLGGAAVALASGIVPLSQSLGLLPGLIAPLGIGLAAAAIGFSDAGVKGLQFHNVMTQLSSAFGPVIDSLRSQMQPAVQAFIQSIQSMAPAVQAVVPVISQAMSQVLNSFSQVFKSSSFQNDFKNLMTAAAGNVQVFGDAAKNAFLGLTNVAVAAQPAVNRIAQDIGQAAQKFNEWTAAARQSGELTTIFQQAATVLEQLGNTVMNIAGLFKDLWDSANRTGAFTATLDAINAGITQFRDYVSQAGGAWDQLMQKAGSVTESLLGLIGSIGQAFVDMGNSVDISGIFDTMSQAIQNMSSTFQQIGQVATPVFENLITIIGRVVQALGPSLVDAISGFGAAIQNFPWEGFTVGMATAIKGTSDFLRIMTTTFQGVVAGGTAMAQALSGDFSGAAQTLAQFAVQADGARRIIGNNQPIDAARESIRGFNNELRGIKSPPPIGITADSSGAQSAIGGTKSAIDGLQGKSVTIGADATPATTAISQAQTTLDRFALGTNPIVRIGADITNLAAAIPQATSQVATVPETHDTTFAGDDSSLLGKALSARSAILGVVPEWLTSFLGEDSSVLGTIARSREAIQSVETTHTTTFTGDGAGLLSAAAGGQSAIQGVVPDWLTKFAGDTANLIASASQATSSTTAVPVEHKAFFTGDASGVQGAAAQAAGAAASVPTQTLTALLGDAGGIVGAAASAIGQINAVPTDHNTAITGDASGLVSGAGQASTAVGAIPTDHNTAILGDSSNLTAGAASASGAIAGIPADHSTAIQADDQASGVISSIISALASIPTFIQTVVQTVYQTVGGAGGLIMTAGMAGGGMLAPMARGGNLRPNMSGSAARIVPPNTWRVIGDRLTDDEAFIPINNSGWSKAILGETANRMGYALVPMSRGGSLSGSSLGDVLAELGIGNGWWHGGSGSGGGSGGGSQVMEQSSVPIYEPSSHLATTMASFGAGKVAAITRMVQDYRATGAYSLGNVEVPSSPGGGSAPPPPVHVHCHFDSMGLGDFEKSFMTWLRKNIRVQGGVQSAFGDR
jgi:hypothetical protein